VIVFGSALIALFSTLAYKASHLAPPSPARGSGAVPVHYDSAGDAMPFPATLEPASFKQTEVREAYQTAKEMSEVLAQQPCYCYCQLKGHAVSWTASRRITRQVAVSASGRHFSPPKCIASRNRRRRSGGLSLKGRGPAGEFKPMIVTRPVQLQPNQRRGIIIMYVT
jgi:hypothetical protein